MERPRPARGRTGQGATGWDYASLLPFFRRSERTHGRDPLVRGTAGPMRIEDGPPPDALARACFQAAVEAGYDVSPDGNGVQAEGVSWGETNVVAGQRQSAADAYLRPALSRPNLTVITDALARRLLLDGSHCHGVEYATAGGTQAVHADREVVLSAGTIGSPQLLMLSGIGPAAQLAEAGVEVRADLPGVGQNLCDHILTWVAYTAARPMSAAPSRQARLLSRSTDGADPDLEMRFAPAALRPRWSGARPDGFSIFFALVSPASRGSLRLRSGDPAAAPLLDPAYLSDERDVDRMVIGLRRARAIAGTDALAPWRGDELLPGPVPRDDQASRDYIRRTAATYFHPAGTCAIGTGALAVVDPLLRVRGVDGLRVADASVMPSLVSAPLNATVLAIAERAASLLAGEGVRPAG